MEQWGLAKEEEGLLESPRWWRWKWLWASRASDACFRRVSSGEWELGSRAPPWIGWFDLSITSWGGHNGLIY
ncbi:hypothetical protein QYF36_005541 [Acer negundo]|nr:hypothetical protein QYF36_005541 [Acer negundo]